METPDDNARVLLPTAPARGPTWRSRAFILIIKGTEVVAGVLLLANRWVPFALTVLAPVVVNIVAFHVFLAPAGMGLPLVVVALGVYLAWSERAAFAPLFKTHARRATEPSSRIGSHATTSA